MEEDLEAQWDFYKLIIIPPALSLQNRTDTIKVDKLHRFHPNRMLQITYFVIFI